MKRPQSTTARRANPGGQQWSLLSSPASGSWLLAPLLAVVFCCLLQTSPSHAFGLTECAASRFGSNLGCTANDVSITGLYLAPGGPEKCVGGETVLVDLDVVVNFASPDRYDIGIFLATDGKSPIRTPVNGGAGSCTVSILPTTYPFMDLDGVPAGTADTCGDGSKSSVGGGTGSGVLRMTGVPVACQALNLSGGKLYIPFVVSWDNQSSPSGSLCTSAADPVPTTSSKCNAPSTTVQTEVDLGTVNTVVLPAISKTDGLSTIIAGNPLTYTVTISNTTGATLSNAVFTDPAVADLTVNSLACLAIGGATCPATSIAALQGSGITIPPMPVGSSVIFSINATVSPTAPMGPLTNTARVTVLGQSNSASDTTSILQLPSISLVKSVEPATVQPGTEMTYAILYRNSGRGPATSLVISDMIPPYTSYESESMRLGTASSTYATAALLTDAADSDVGTSYGSVVVFSINTVAADDGAANSGNDEGKVYFKVRVN